MKQTIAKILPAITVASLFLVLSISLLPSQTSALAGKQLSDTAAQACKGESNKQDKYKNSARSACIKGYVAGYTADGIKKTCDPLKSKKAECEAGYAKGKKNAATPTQNNLSSRQLDAKAAQVCSKESNKQDKYKNSARSACAAGYKAGYKGDSKSVCDKLKSHKSDCTDAYNKGKKAAGGGATVTHTTASKDQAPGDTGSDACGEKYCTDPAVNPDKECNQDQCDLIKQYLNPAISVLSGLVGLAVVISIIIGGIQYSASEGDPQKASKAKTRISNAIFALIAYLFLYAFLQFIIPGGVFR